MNEHKTIITTDLEKALAPLLKQCKPDAIYVVTDAQVAHYCLTDLLQISGFEGSHVIMIPIGEMHKNIDTVSNIWRYLMDYGATCSSLLVNLGGGMVSDLGGFAASTFKRGMPYINLPTTLLGAVDAATGGKTGINFQGLKNEIGLYNPALSVVVNMEFFKSLDQKNFRSGFAEMVKHGLISDPILLEQTMAFDLDQPDWKRLKILLEQNLTIKQRIVETDPHETGKRKALNFGHTFGHAFETLSYTLDQPLLHGYAVMWGMVCAMYLSHIKFKLPKELVMQMLYFTKEHYGAFPFTCNHYEPLLELMKHDKKNESDHVNYSLLANVGDVRINQHATEEEVLEALDFVREN